MITDWVRGVISFILLVLLQVLILNGIPFLGLAIGFPYIYFIIKQPVGINRNFLLILAFILGFTIDIFSNTPGVHAAATTLVAFSRRGIQGLFFSREDFDQEIPKLATLRDAFVKYVVAMILLHHTVLIFLESFSYSNPLIMVAKILGSSILSFIFIMGFELVFNKNQRG